MIDPMEPHGGAKMMDRSRDSLVQKPMVLKTKMLNEHKFKAATRK